MMLGLSFDFIGGGYSLESPTALWWIQLATAVVFGLGIATVLTLVFTPSMLAIRIWAVHYTLALARLMSRLSFGRRGAQAAEDFALRRAARRQGLPELLWDDAADAQALAEVAPELETALATSQAKAGTVPKPATDTKNDPDANTKADDPEEPPLRAAE
jgi:multidrug efflux pump